MVSPWGNRRLERLRCFLKTRHLANDWGGLYLRSVSPQSLCPSFSTFEIFVEMMTLGSPFWVLPGWELYKLQLLIPLVIMNHCRVLGPPHTTGWVGDPSAFPEQGIANYRVLGTAWPLGPSAGGIQFLLNFGDAPVVGSLWDQTRCYDWWDGADTEANKWLVLTLVKWDFSWSSWPAAESLAASLRDPPGSLSRAPMLWSVILL